MKKLVFLIIGCLLLLLTPFLSCTAYAESSDQAEKINQVDHYIETQMKAAHIPGLAIGIVKGNQIVHLKGYGKEVSPQTPFILGSTTKSFTAMAIMQLVEEDMVELDSPIQNYLPNINTSQITVRHLLNQNSGISSTEKFQINHKKIGQEFQYSNQNYKLLGQIITSASGIPYEEYVRKNIFSPLDMNHSYTSQSAAKEHGLAAGYRTWFGMNLPNELPFNDEYLSAGYLISNAEDMTHYLMAQMNHGQYSNETVVSDSSMKEMHKRSVKAPIMGEDSYYGMGWFVRSINGVPTIMHPGEVPNYHSTMIIMPEENYGIIILANINNSILISGLIEKIGAGVVDLLAGKEPASISKSAYYQTYLIIDGVILIMIVLLFFHIKNISSWHSGFIKGELGLFKKFIFPLSINFLIPLLILTKLPGSIGFTWSFLFDFIPDVAGTVWVIAIVLLIAGCIKLFLGALFYKTNRSRNLNI